MAGLSALDLAGMVLGSLKKRGVPPASKGILALTIIGAIKGSLPRSVLDCGGPASRVRDSGSLGCCCPESGRSAIPCGWVESKMDIPAR